MNFRVPILCCVDNSQPTILTNVMVSRPVTNFRANPSNLGTYAQCRLKFKLLVLDRLDKEYPARGAALAFGSNIHETFRDFFILVPELRSVQKLLEMAQRIFRLNPERFDSREELLAHWERAKVTLRQFAQNEDLTARPVLVEQNLYRNFDDFTMSGKIDRIDREPDGLFHVIDYKTGKPRPERLPLQIYAALAADRYKVDELRVSYLYLESDASSWVTEHASQAFVDEGISEVRRRMTEMRAETEFAAQPGPLCGWCQFLPICDEGRAYLDSRPAPLTQEELPM
jgi:RecB family exonuclease